jgi:hypothetical protein
MLHLASSVCGLFKWRQFEPEVYTAFEEICDNLTKAGVPLYWKRL